MKEALPNYLLAHEFCTNNKDALSSDKICGCFYCLNIFKPEEIEMWVNEKSGTAICPYCGIDSVIGESSGYPINMEFLSKMKKYWFETDTQLDSFKLEGNGGYILIKVLEVYGFPNNTSYLGGYDAKGAIEIKSNNYNVSSELYFSTGEIQKFLWALKKCYDESKGMAQLVTSEQNLELSVSFDKVGHTLISGEYMEGFDLLNNKLIFEIIGDQSYLPRAIKDLENIVKKYSKTE